MTHIIIKNVGPIKNVELNLNKINVFMGPQSSGKSTIAKIISYCSWYEKNYILEAKPLKDFYNELLEFHNLEDTYFCDDSYIEYQSKNSCIVFSGKDKKNVKIMVTVNADNVFKNEKIEYIPAERNVVAISGIGEYNKNHNNILGFLYEWFEAKREKKRNTLFTLPLKTLNDVSYYYSQEDDADHIVLGDGKEIKLQHSSSGLISATPLIIVFDYIINGIYLKNRIKTPFEIVNLKAKLALLEENIKKEVLVKLMNKMEETRAKLESTKEEFRKVEESIINNKEKAESSKEKTDSVRAKLDDMEKEIYRLQNEFNMNMGFDADYNYSKVIIEEPELNLFPNTQQELIYYILSVLNSSERNHQLVLTTHSPYILFSLNNCMMGGLVKNSIPEEERNGFASYRAWVDPKKVSIYEIHDGSLKSIQDEDGIIEDNYLNKAYKENSTEYMSLLNYFEDEK